MTHRDPDSFGMNRERELNSQEETVRITARYNKLTITLTTCIVFLTAITILPNFSKTGRYAISGVSERSAYVLDTKTSELWIRAIGGVNIYMGTNENPTSRPITIKKDGDAEKGSKENE